MKHTFQITFLLLGLFLLSHIIGLVVVDSFLGEELPLNLERPDMDAKGSFLTIVFAIVFVTVIALLLMKFKLFGLWKFWFFLSVFLTLTISFSAFFSETLALVVAVFLALWKVLRPNMYVHNFTELFVYAAIAVIFAPLLTIPSVILLLVAISIYDYIAVRKTKHMITLAKMQDKLKVFAGFFIPYGKNVAILGGGDIGFSLLFSSVVFSVYNLGLLDFRTYIVPLFSMLALGFLFMRGEKKKYYPAMPYITAGCLIGLGIVLLLV